MSSGGFPSFRFEIMSPTVSLAVVVVVASVVAVAVEGCSFVTGLVRRDGRLNLVLEIWLLVTFLLGEAERSTAWGSLLVLAVEGVVTDVLLIVVVRALETVVLGGDVGFFSPGRSRGKGRNLLRPRVVAGLGVVEAFLASGSTSLSTSLAGLLWNFFLNDDGGINLGLAFRLVARIPPPTFFSALAAIDSFSAFLASASLSFRS